MKHVLHALLICALALVLPGCATKKEKARRYYEQHPYDLAEICAEKYPTKIKNIPGKEVVRYDTIETKADSVPCPPDAEGKVVYIPGKERVVTRTVTRVDTVEKENTAALEAANAKANKYYFKAESEAQKNKELTEAKNKSDLWKKIFLGWAVLATAWLVKKML